MRHLPKDLTLAIWGIDQSDHVGDSHISLQVVGLVVHSELYRLPAVVDTALTHVRDYLVTTMVP